jgi:hypothetical protein
VPWNTYFLIRQKKFSKSYHQRGSFLKVFKIELIKILAEFCCGMSKGMNLTSSALNFSDEVEKRASISQTSMVGGVEILHKCNIVTRRGIQSEKRSLSATSEIFILEHELPVKKRPRRGCAGTNWVG